MWRESAQCPFLHRCFDLWRVQLASPLEVDKLRSDFELRSYSHAVDSDSDSDVDVDSDDGRWEGPAVDLLHIQLGDNLLFHLGLLLLHFFHVLSHRFRAMHDDHFW